MEFKESCQPTDEELQQWAAIEGGYWPEQDFDIMVTTSDRIGLFVELVEDKTCRQRHFFLSCLYLLVGDAVRSNYNTSSRGVVDDLIERCRHSQSSPLKSLAERTSRLIEQPETFDYISWCSGGYAYQAVFE